MHISWLGTTALKIQTKYLETDITVLIDPYKPEKGSFPRSLTANLVLFTRGPKDAITVPGEPFVLDTPGEIDSKGVLVTGVNGHTENSVMYRLDIEGVSISFLGLTKQPLTSEQLEVLSGVDVLCIPTGHPDSFDLENAIKTVNSIEPRVVIPIAFHSDNDPDAKGADALIRELGLPSPTEEKKIIIKKKDLPEEETRIILLGKE